MEKCSFISAVPILKTQGRWVGQCPFKGGFTNLQSLLQHGMDKLAPLSMIFLRKEYWGEFVGLMNKLGLQTDFQNGTCLYVEDLLCSELWFSLGLSLPYSLSHSV